MDTNTYIDQDRDFYGFDGMLWLVKFVKKKKKSRLSDGEAVTAFYQLFLTCEYHSISSRI